MLTSALNDGTGKFEVIDLTALNFIGFGQRRVSFESSGRTHYQPMTLKELSLLGFHAFSRKNLVNLYNVASFDAAAAEFTFKSGAKCKIADKYVSLLAANLPSYRPQPIAYPMIALESKCKLVQLALNDVDFVDLTGRVPQYNVGSRKYRHITIVDEFECDELLEALGLTHLDRGSLVNMARVVRYNRKEGEVYFDKEGIDKPASVAYIMRNIVEGHLGGVYPVIDKTTGRNQTVPNVVPHGLIGSMRQT